MRCWNGNPQEHHASQLAITTAAEEQPQLQQQAAWEETRQQLQQEASAVAGKQAWKLEADAINAAWRELQFQDAERALAAREAAASVHVDNVVSGEPAAEPHQPEAIDDAMGWELLDSEAVAGERAEEPHQQGTRSESMDRRRQQPAGRGDDRSDSKRLGKALVSILRHTHKGKWLKLDELVQILRHPQTASDHHPDWA